MKKKYVASALVVPAFLIALSGCGTTEQVQESSIQSEAVEVSEVEEDLLTIGEKTDDAYDVILLNSTGSDITSISVACDEEDAFAVSDAGIEADMAFELFYEPEETESESAGNDNKLLTPDYTITFTLDSGDEYILHGFPFDDIEEGEILIDDIEDVAYIIYDSIDSGDEISTLEDEIATKEAEEAEAAADAAAQAVTKQSSYSSSSYSSGGSSSYSAGSSSSGSSSTGSSSSSGGSSSSSGDDDSCLSDGLTY